MTAADAVRSACGRSLVGAGRRRPAVTSRRSGCGSAGHGLVDDESVLAYTSLEGRATSSTAPAVSRDVKALQKTGRFSYVSASRSSGAGRRAWSYVVREQARASADLEIAGADDLGNKKVRELLELGVGDLVDDAMLAVASQKVTEHVPQGVLSRRQARPGRSTPADGTAAWRDVKINVEGRQARQRQADPLRRQQARQRAQALRKAMKQRRSTGLSWITGAGTYNPDDAGGRP